MTGLPAVSPSGLPWDNNEDTYPYKPVGGTKTVFYYDHTPIVMTAEDIKSTIGDYCTAAKVAMEECGFDGVEVHGGNGYAAQIRTFHQGSPLAYHRYLPEQFLSSNINVRTDVYGGSPEKRCNFVLELMDGLAEAVGEENTALRLSPFGLYNQTRGVERLATWSHLCKELKKNHHKISYVSFIEPVSFSISISTQPSGLLNLQRPSATQRGRNYANKQQRYEQMHSTVEKDAFLASWGLAAVDLALFRSIFGSTPLFSAGGWNNENWQGEIESGRYDALLFGRWFTSNRDLVKRLREGQPLRKYERDRFYGPFPDKERGYTDYAAWGEEKDEGIAGIGEVVGGVSQRVSKVLPL